MSEPLAPQIRALMARGEYLAAYDLAMNATQNSGDEVKYLAVLCLARSGATHRASQLYKEYGFAASDNEDYAALGARLAKDHALTAGDAERGNLLRDAARRYQAVYARTGGYYTAINAATLYRLAGDADQASRLARDALQRCEQTGRESGLGEYYRLASMAEASLILDDREQTRALLALAAGHVGTDYAAMATTRRQLAMLLPADDSSTLAALAAPTVIHFCGHLMSGDPQRSRFKAAAEPQLAGAIAAQLDAANVGFGYGSLASGADILFAEALLARGAYLHVVLPFNEQEFVEVSVRPAGERWVQRFEHCLARASSTSYATEDDYLGDNILFHYATRLAMGLAIQKANNLCGTPRQFAIWDGQIGGGIAGTYADIRTWQRQGYGSELLNATDGSTLSVPHDDTPLDDDSAPGRRRAHAMLFGDVKGFSKLHDRQIPAFVNDILGGLGKALQPFDDDILIRNTWGDGLFVVMRDAISAARCAMALQEAMRDIDLQACGLPEHIALRLGAHYGPVYELDDPVLHRKNYFGAHVSKTARIEPVTPEGEVFVTRQLAAEIALHGNSGFGAEYVGIMPAAKKYGDLPMYLLRRTRGNA